MVLNVRALAWFCTLLFPIAGRVAAQPSARESYRLGAAAISDGDVAAAVKHLEALASLAKSGDTQAQELVAQTRLPLVQLYLSAGQIEKARRGCLETIEIQRNSEPAASIAFVQQLSVLAIRTAQADRQSSEHTVELLAALHRLLMKESASDNPSSDSKKALAKLRLAASQALVKAHCARTEFDSAADHLRSEISRSTTGSQALAKLLSSVQVAATQHYFQQGNLEKCREVGDRLDLDALPTAQQIAVRVILLDCYFQARQLASAGELSDWFGQYFAEHDGASTLPAWYPTVQLRRAQIAHARRQYSDALAIARSGLEHAPSDSLRAEFRILEVKLAIAQVRFSYANDMLMQLASELPRQSAQSQQVCWMTGELEFLQRRYSNAAEAYIHLVESGAPTWKPLALVQLAKCHELLGRPGEALLCYQQVAALAQDADAPPATATVAKAIEQAKQRLAVIAANQSAEGQTNR